MTGPGASTQRGAASAGTPRESDSPFAVPLPVPAPALCGPGLRPSGLWRGKIVLNVVPSSHVGPCNALLALPFTDLSSSPGAPAVPHAPDSVQKLGSNLVQSLGGVLRTCVPHAAAALQPTAVPNTWVDSESDELKPTATESSTGSTSPACSYSSTLLSVEDVASLLAMPEVDEHARAGTWSDSRLLTPSSVPRTESSRRRKARDATTKLAQGRGGAAVAGSDIQRRCVQCHTTTSPKWRCNMTLCNACGLRNRAKVRVRLSLRLLPSPEAHVSPRTPRALAEHKGNEKLRHRKRREPHLRAAASTRLF